MTVASGQTAALFRIVRCFTISAMPTRIPRLPQVGEGTLAVLRQAGINTNLDLLRIEMRGPGFLEDIPGIGPGRAAILREWARESASPQDIDQIHSERQAAAQRELVEEQEKEKRDTKFAFLFVFGILVVSVVLAALFDPFG